MASDNFAATNNPLASPWVAGGGAFGAMESSGGVTFCSTHDVISAMVYGSSSVQSSQIKIAARVAGFAGPCLVDPATGNGYVAHTDSDGTDLIIIRYAAGVFAADSGVTTFATAVNDTLRLYFDGTNVKLDVNGTLRVTWADNTYRTGCKPGVQGENEGDHLDDWTDGAAEAPANVYVSGTAQRNRRHTGRFM